MSNRPMKQLARFKSYYSFWSSMRPEVVAVGFSGLVVYLLITLWLRTIPELFPGAAAIGNMVATIALSLVAAFVFFIVNIHMNERRSRKRVFQYISPMVKDIMLQGVGFLHSVDIHKRLSLECMHYSYTDIMRVLRIYSRDQPVPKAQLISNYRARKEKITKHIDELLVHYAGLDSDMINILIGIKQSYLFLRIDTYSHDEEITELSDGIFEMLCRLRDLNDHTSRYVADYFEDIEHPDLLMLEKYLMNRDELRKRRRSERSRSIARVDQMLGYE